MVARFANLCDQALEVSSLNRHCGHFSHFNIREFARQGATMHSRDRNYDLDGEIITVGLRIMTEAEYADSPLRASPHLWPAWHLDGEIVVLTSVVVAKPVSSMDGVSRSLASAN